MKLQLDRPRKDHFQIRAHQPGAVTVNDQVMRASFILAVDRLLPDWAPASGAELDEVHVQGILELEPELVLIGTGQHLRFPRAAALKPLVVAGIGYEIMDTGAACRTFNVLAAEGRKVVAGLMIDTA